MASVLCSNEVKWTFTASCLRVSPLPSMDFWALPVSLPTHRPEHQSMVLIDAGCCSWWWQVMVFWCFMGVSWWLIMVNDSVDCKVNRCKSLRLLSIIGKSMVTMVTDVNRKSIVNDWHTMPNNGYNNDGELVLEGGCWCCLLYLATPSHAGPHPANYLSLLVVVVEIVVVAGGGGGGAFVIILDISWPFSFLLVVVLDSPFRTTETFCCRFNGCCRMTLSAHGQECGMTNFPPVDMDVDRRTESMRARPILAQWQTMSSLWTLNCCSRNLNVVFAVQMVYSK